MENIIVEPPLYFAEEQVFDVVFHPQRDILVASLITGQIEILKYNEDDVVKLTQLNHHKLSCRQSIFSPDGNILASVSKDKSFGVIDTNGVLQIHNKNAHKDSINTAQFLNNEILSTGDDSGNIKIWDLRSPYTAIFEASGQTECINGIQFAKNCTQMLSCSQDGTLAVYDLRKSNNSEKKLVSRSDCMEEDLTDMCLVKHEQFVACSTSLGVILLFKWNYFEDCLDRIPGHPNSIECMVKLDENTLITGNEDGFARGVSIYPNDVTDILGQHEEDDHFPIQKISISHCKNFMASCSHDSSIKFYDISNFVKKRSNTLCKTQFNEVMSSDDEMQIEKRKKEKGKQEKEEIMDNDDEDEDEEGEDSEDGGDGDEMDEDGIFTEDSDDDSDGEEHKDQEKKSKKRKYNPNTKTLKKEVERQKRMDFFSDI